MKVIHTIASTRLDHVGTSRSVPATCDALAAAGTATMFNQAGYDRMKTANDTDVKKWGTLIFAHQTLMGLRVLYQVNKKATD